MLAFAFNIRKVRNKVSATLGKAFTQLLIMSSIVIHQSKQAVFLGVKILAGRLVILA